MLSFLPMGWQHRLSSRRTRRRGQSKHRSSAHLVLEPLEDRTLLSTLKVFSSSDDVGQKGTLRYAVAHAQAGDTINLDPSLASSPIVLMNGELLLDKDLTIQGLGPSLITVSGGGLSRVFEISAEVNVALSDLILTSGNGVANNPNGTTSDDGSGGAILNYGNLIISGSALSNNSSSRNNGAIASFSGSLKVIACSLTANTGGAILNADFGTAIVKNSTISGNLSGFFGGGITNIGTLSVIRCNLTGNSAALGGGIVNFIGPMTVDASTFSGNSAQISGGAILNVGIGTLSNCILTNNIAEAGGGIDNGTFSPGSLPVILSINGSTLSGNSAIFSGGGIYAESGGTVSITGSSLTNNSASDGHGGGIFDDTSVLLSVVNSSLSGNSAQFSGGGIFISAFGSATINSSSLSGNSAQESGGGIYSVQAIVAVSDSTLSGNSAAVFGGGIFSSFFATLTVNNCTLSGNSANSGAGIFNNFFSTVTINGSTFSENSALISGGGIYTTEFGSVTVTGSTFTGNSAASGGGIFNSFFDPSTVILSFSTFCMNTPDNIEGQYFDFGGNVFC